jgi:hypothetical protein
VGDSEVIPMLSPTLARSQALDEASRKVRLPLAFYLVVEIGGSFHDKVAKNVAKICIGLRGDSRRRRADTSDNPKAGVDRLRRAIGTFWNVIDGWRACNLLENGGQRRDRTADAGLFRAGVAPVTRNMARIFDL